MAVRFYRSLYVTLGLACACLGYAEMAFLPEVVVFAIVVGILLAVAYCVEGRWSLSIRAANVLGAVIGVGAIIYAGLQFLRPAGTLLESLPLPTSLLPYLGPLLMVLIPAKLFRPKHHGDYWGLQGIGLIAVALGCALAGDGIFGVLMLAYLVCAMWSLTLFYYFREGQWVQVSVSRRRTAEPRLLGKTGLWATVVCCFAVGLFLLTPRSGDARWEFSVVSGKLQTGYSDERPSIDLNNTGTLAVNRDLVFEVTARTASGEMKTDLGKGQRWRGTTFNYYDSGRWENRPVAEHRDRPILRELNEAKEAVGPPAPKSGEMPTREASGPMMRPGIRRESVPLPKLGPNEFMLDFLLSVRGPQSLFLAEPIWKSPMETPPGQRKISVVTVMRSGNQYPWYQSPDDEFAPPATGMSAAFPHYRQVVLPPAEPGVSEPVAVSDVFREHLCNHDKVRALRDWTGDLVRRLAAQGRIPPGVVAGGESGEALNISPLHAETVARALEDYLGASGAYTYSLSLQRENDRLDPIEDFLFQTKRGNCSRFATALTLMLRSVGIPARIVLGFRGFETAGEGIYEVRQCDSHAWVEALIQRQVGGKTTWRWRTLDPTPSTDEVAASTFSWSQFLESARNGIAVFFRQFIVEYDVAQQSRARTFFSSIEWANLRTSGLDALLGTSRSEWWRPIVLVGATYGGFTMLRRWRRGRRRARRAAREPATALFTRMRDLVRRWVDLEPARSQTPAEFAEVASQRLSARGAVPAFAGLPTETVVVYYRVRYGNQDLPDEDRLGLAGRLDRFESELTRDQNRSG